MKTPKTVMVITALLLFLVLSSFPASSAFAGLIAGSGCNDQGGDIRLIGTVSADKTNVYSGPSSDSTVLGTAEKGGRYAVLGIYGEWYKILFNGTAGFLRKTGMQVKAEDVSQNSDITLKAATFNVQALSGGKTAYRAAELLKEAGADVAGVQEVDRYTSRSGKTDWAAELAKLSGYQYYFFAPALEYDRGYFGTLILSRYPIIETEAIKLDTAGKEPRVLGYARVLTPGGAVNMFNTHLAIESRKAMAACAASFYDKLSAVGREKYFVTGDFNTTPESLSQYTEGLVTANTEYPTFKGSTQVTDDNILYTPGITAADLTVKDAITRGISDHDLLLVTLTVYRYGGKTLYRGMLTKTAQNVR